MATVAIYLTKEFDMRMTRKRLLGLAVIAAPLIFALTQGGPAMAAPAKTPVPVVSSHTAVLRLPGSLEAPAGSSVTPAAAGCVPIYSFGHRTSTNTETWSYIGGDTQLYFYGSGTRTGFCWSALNTTDTVGFIYTPNGCLTLGSNNHFHIVSTCDPNNLSQQWSELTTQGTASNPYLVALYNYGGGGVCLYENTQELAISASCSVEYTDHFEWFYWPI